MNTDNLFTRVSPPDNDLFFRSKDEHDIRLGEIVETNAESFANAKVVLLSCSQDIGVIRNNGRKGATLGPESIRKAFYKLVAPPSLLKGDLFDLGDSFIDDELEVIHQHHFEIVKMLLEAGKRVVVLGGGNDLSYPDCKAYKSVHPDCKAINIDAHLDIRISDKANSGTPYRQLLDESVLLPSEFYEIGIQPQLNSPKYIEDAKLKQVTIQYLKEVQKAFRSDQLDVLLQPFLSNELFLGFDLDSIKSSDAPGVSAPSPNGLTSEQAIMLVEIIVSGSNVRLFELTEMNPNYDRDDTTAKMAATLAYTYLEKVSGSVSKK